MKLEIRNSIEYDRRLLGRWTGLSRGSLGDSARGLEVVEDSPPDSFSRVINLSVYL